MKSETPRANWRTLVSEDEGEQVAAELAAEVVVAAEVAVTPARRRLTVLKRIALGVSRKRYRVGELREILLRYRRNASATGS